MEEKKKYTFNNDNGKSHYMIVKTGREKEQEVNIEVGKGRIERTEKYRYLGNMITTKGGVAGQLEDIKRKLVGIVGEVKNIGEKEGRKNGLFGEINAVGKSGSANNVV